jgi:hypothetical protein
MDETAFADWLKQHDVTLAPLLTAALLVGASVFIFLMDTFLVDGAGSIRPMADS